MANYDLTTEVEKLEENLRQTRKAILGRGGDISATAGMKDLPLAIFNIPADSSLAYYEDGASAYKKTVPSGAEDYAQLKSVGGMTRVVSTNLFTNASKDGIKWSIRVNQQEEYFSQLLPAGSYRLDVDAESNVEDDCVNWYWGIMLNDSGTSYEGEPIANGFFAITEPKYIVPWVGAVESDTPASITVTQTGGTNEGTVKLGETKTIWIGGGSYCDISIKTNTRVKVTVSDQFETYNGSEEFITEEATEFIVGKGNYTYEWRNTSDSDTSVTIKVEQYSYADIEVTLYPMVYAVPDESEEHILTEYVPYYERLVPTAVTEIVSKGANLAVCTEDLTRTDKGVTFIRESGKSYAVLNGTATLDYGIRLFGYFKLQAGTYTASVYGLNASDRLYIGSGSAVIINNIQKNAPKTFTITEEKECFVQIVLTNGSAYSNTKIEVMLNVGNEAAPYRPYTAEPIDTVDIPDVVKNDAMWGCGVGKYVNTYDFNTKEYSKWIDRTVVLDGVNYKSVNVKTHSTSGCWYADILIGKVTYKDWLGVKFTGFTTVQNYLYGTGYIYGSADGLRARLFVSANIDTKEKADAWLKENPVEMQYALENPIVTTIDDDSLAPRFVKVEGGGEIVFENEAKADVPSTIQYVQKVGT
jgi:hypothetical protein